MEIVNYIGFLVLISFDDFRIGIRYFSIIYKILNNEIRKRSIFEVCTGGYISGSYSSTFPSSAKQKDLTKNLM